MYRFSPRQKPPRAPDPPTPTDRVSELLVLGAYLYRDANFLRTLKESGVTGPADLATMFGLLSDVERQAVRAIAAHVEEWLPCLSNA